jgi:mannose-6-phosphate isomerase
VKLKAVSVPKVWGRSDLPPPFGTTVTDPVGEIWFAAGDAPLPLLAKYIFTSERLSVQVHPNDEQARARGHASGKAECWLILDAGPGATIGLGTGQPMPAGALRAASLSGDIEHLLDWRPVARGDFLYVPAGTVHAIGAGICLVEIQQYADITYRLYDYGRPRELHLDDGVAVADARPYADPRARHVDLDALAPETALRLVDGPFFTLDLTTQSHGHAAAQALLLPLVGTVTVAGESVDAGACLALDTDTEWHLSTGGQLLVAR